MIAQVSHLIQYSYSSPVFLEPHVFKLRPRNDPSRQTKFFSLSVDPQPAGLHEFLDAEGNLAACAWFEGKISSLAIRSIFSIETRAENPFNYFITDNGFLSIPARYSGIESAVLSLYLGDSEYCAEIMSFISPIIQEADHKSILFLSLLNNTLYEEFAVTHRKEGAPLPPAFVLQSKEGACRDLAVLFVACCRAAGIAARFVSGYHEGGGNETNPELHAWAEVYIPGGGWTGYDPTLGLAVAEQHIPLAASAYPEGAAPVVGKYRGTGVSAEMHFVIKTSSML